SLFGWGRPMSSRTRREELIAFIERVLTRNPELRDQYAKRLASAGKAETLESLEVNAEALPAILGSSSDAALEMIVSEERPVLFIEKDGLNLRYAKHPLSFQIVGERHANEPRRRLLTDGEPGSFQADRFRLGETRGAIPISLEGMQIVLRDFWIVEDQACVAVEAHPEAAPILTSEQHALAIHDDPLGVRIAQPPDDGVDVLQPASLELLHVVPQIGRVAKDHAEIVDLVRPIYDGIHEARKIAAGVLIHVDLLIL